MSSTLWPYGLKPTRLLCPSDPPDKITGVGCHALLQGILLIHRSNLLLLSLPHCQVDSLHLVPPGKPPTPRLATKKAVIISLFLYHPHSPNTQRQFTSVTQSCMTLRPHEQQDARPLCPSPTPGVHPNPCLLSCWWRPTISSSVIPFSSRPQSFPASGSFQMNQFSLQVAKVLEFQIQNQSFQWTPRTDLF